MSEFLVPGLDALLYLVSFLILAKFLVIAMKIISKGDANSKLVNGILVVLGMMILKASFELRIDTWVPDQTATVQLALIYAITFAGTLFLVFWRFATPILDASLASILMVAISYGHGIGMPMLSERVLPEGKTFAEFVNLANDKIQEQKQVIEDLKNSGALEALAAANKGKEAPSIKEAFSAIADLTSENEFGMIRNEFATGMEVIAERMAIMEAMSPEERESYKAEMAAFMAEQGLSNNPYNLKALKSVKSQDVQDMAAFMESMQGTMGMAGMGAGDEGSDKELPGLSSSLMRIAQNIKQTELTDSDKKALSVFSSLIRKASMDEAIQKAKADVEESKGKDPIASTMLAALLETKAEMPISDFIEQELGGGTATAQSGQAATTGDESELAEPEVELLPIPIKRGVVRILDSEESWDRYLAAANALQIKGFVLSRGEKEIHKVVLGSEAVAENSKWRMEHDGRNYIFRVDEVSTGMAYLSVMF